MYEYSADFYRYLASFAARSARAVVPRLTAFLPVRSVVDFGCGQGAWLSVWRSTGASVVGVDGPYVDPNRLLIDAAAFHAADLYRTGLAPVVVASGRALRSYAGIAEMIQHDLESFGVPEAAIVKFPQRAENTREEAEALAPLISSRSWKRVLIVTSNYHARRARFIFERVVPSGVSVSVSGAHDSEFDPASWWETRQGRKLFLGELFGYAVAWWELRGKPASSPGEGLLTLSAGGFLVGAALP